jgi:hypothetical protein
VHHWGVPTFTSLQNAQKISHNNYLQETEEALKVMAEKIRLEEQKQHKIDEDDDDDDGDKLFGKFHLSFFFLSA